MTFLGDVSYMWGKVIPEMEKQSFWNTALFIMLYMPKWVAPLKCVRHPLSYYCSTCFACTCSRNQKTDERIIAVKNQCLSFSIFIMTMNAGLSHLNTRIGIIHVEEIRYRTKGSSVRGVGWNISEPVQNRCLRYTFNFPFLPFLFFLQSWTVTLEAIF